MLYFIPSMNRANWLESKLATPPPWICVRLKALRRYVSISWFIPNDFGHNKGSAFRWLLKWDPRWLRSWDKLLKQTWTQANLRFIEIFTSYHVWMEHFRFYQTFNIFSKFLLKIFLKALNMHIESINNLPICEQL